MSNRGVCRTVPATPGLLKKKRETRNKKGHCKAHECAAKSPSYSALKVCKSQTEDSANTPLTPSHFTHYW